MKRDMFEDVVTPSPTTRSPRWQMLPISVLSHLVVVGVLVVAPLTATSFLPMPQLVLAFAAPVPLPAPPPPPALPTITVSQQRPAPEARLNPAAPTAAPDRTGIEPALPGSAERAPARLRESGSPVAFVPSTTTALATVAPVNQTPVRVGGAIGEPRKVQHVAPIYPAIARAARHEGLVILEATISRDGNVIDARVLRSSQLFDQAAIDAVRQWRYTPTTLNGTPVDVTMTVTVQFRLE